MKPLNETELSSLVQWIRPQVVGGQLQDIGVDADGLWLGIYRQCLHYIHIDLKPGRGFLVLWPDQNIVRQKASMRPVALFLNSHAKNLELVDLQMRSGFGRVVEFEFSSADGSQKCRLEVVLIPQALNAIAEAHGKKIAWVKPKTFDKQLEAQNFPVRWTDWDQYIEEYLKFRNFKNSAAGGESTTDTAAVDPRLKTWQKDIDKKQGIIIRLQEGLDSGAADEWQAFGEELKFGKDLPESPMWDAKLELNQNRERAFQKAKDLRAKKIGTLQRISELQKEIEKLHQWIEKPQSVTQNQTGQRRGTQVLQKSESKGKTLNLPSGLQAVLGRSAKDNLAILRQARAWDLWVHLKDEPSAHAIIFRDKNKNVSREDIEAVALWIWKASSGQKLQMDGLRFDVVCVECRFVRPIKGDKLGRVNYHSPTVYSFASKAVRP